MRTLRALGLAVMLCVGAAMASGSARATTYGLADGDTFLTQGAPGTVTASFTSFLVLPDGSTFSETLRFFLEDSNFVEVTQAPTLYVLSLNLNGTTTTQYSGPIKFDVPASVAMIIVSADWELCDVQNNCPGNTGQGILPDLITFTTAAPILPALPLFATGLAAIWLPTRRQRKITPRD